MKIAHGSLAWDLKVKGYGHGDHIANVRFAAPVMAGANRVEYRSKDVMQWYVNGPAGLEQGFTFTSRSSGQIEGPLTVAVEISGNVVPELAPDHAAVTLRQVGSRESFLYSGLSATDSRGKDLPVWLEVHAQELLLRVDDRGAQYPLVIDPVIHMAKLTNTNPGDPDSFGYAVAVSGNTIVVGDPVADINYAFQGTAYVFVKPESGWQNMTQTAQLSPSDAQTQALFGFSVAIEGDTIIIGADQATVNGKQNFGEAYVYVKPASGWANMTETAKLLPEGPVCPVGCDFGFAVGISGKTVVVGAPYVSVNGSEEAGAAYIFVEPTGGWADMTQTAELTAADASYSALFGVSAAIDGNTAVVGAEYQTLNDIKKSGEVYVFVEPATGWANMTETADLYASNAGEDAFLGRSVGISGNTIVAGAPNAPASQKGAPGPGIVYVYVEPPGGWVLSTETAQLSVAGMADGAQFGVALAFNGSDVASAAFGGAPAYIFEKPKSGWTTTSTPNLMINDPVTGDTFGYSFGLDANTLVVGAPSLPDGPGAAYVFWP